MPLLGHVYKHSCHTPTIWMIELGQLMYFGEFITRNIFKTTENFALKFSALVF